MAVEYTLRMQKASAGSPVKDTLSSFGFATGEITWPDAETCEVASRVWPGEHGEDTYIPPGGLKLKAYDLEIELCYKGTPGSAYAAYKALRDYLTGIDGTGGELKIYDPYWHVGRRGVYVKKIGNLSAARTNIDEVLSCTVTFHVSDPVTEIVIGND